MSIITKFKMILKLAYNQWYLSQLTFDPKYSRDGADAVESIAYQRRVIRVLKRKIDQA